MNVKFLAVAKGSMEHSRPNSHVRLQHKSIVSEFERRRNYLRVTEKCHRNNGLLFLSGAMFIGAAFISPCNCCVFRSLYSVYCLCVMCTVLLYCVYCLCVMCAVLLYCVYCLCVNVCCTAVLCVLFVCNVYCTAVLCVLFVCNVFV
jgi:hypothetical protein